MKNKIIILILSILILVNYNTKAESPQYLPDFPENAVVKIFSYNGIKLADMLFNQIPFLSCGHGSGLVFDENGLILTAKHVVDSCKYIFVHFPNEELVLKAEVIFKSEQEDAALIYVSDFKKLKSKFYYNTKNKLFTPYKGEEVWAYGYPLHIFEDEPHVTKGIITRLSSKLNYWLQSDATILHGNSGGPLVNKSGNLVGINSAQIDDEYAGTLYYFLPFKNISNEIDRFLKNDLDRSISKNITGSSYIEKLNFSFLKNFQYKMQLNQYNEITGNIPFSVNFNSLDSVTKEFEIKTQKMMFFSESSNIIKATIMAKELLLYSNYLLTRMKLSEANDFYNEYSEYFSEEEMDEKMKDFREQISKYKIVALRYAEELKKFDISEEDKYPYLFIYNELINY
ncbi:trypsin-like peptidase domain-containing protein [Candidatus Gracilibacteria bacterium]|nr:trypsin-like peptidase domain-containing protein [Candidatus Gracilibacteria bacterium]